MSTPGAPKVKRRRLLRAGAGAALALPFLGRGAQAAVTWTLFSQQTNPSSVVSRGLRRLSDQVRDRTRGALLINVRTAGLVPIDANHVLDAVATGKVELGDDASYGATILPAGVLRLPLLATSTAEWDKVAAVVRPSIVAELEQRGMVLVAHYRLPLQMFWSRTKATAFADMARQRLRVHSQEQGEFVRHYSAVNIITSSVETEEALVSGRLHGTFSAAATFGRQWKALLKHVYLAGPNFDDAVIVAGREAVANLPEGIAPVLIAAGADAADWIARTQDAEERQIVGALSGEGLKATPADVAELRDGMARLPAYWDSWVRLRGGETESLLASIRLMLDR
jgi:TRAP-type C4-dicarboxylate transport system substrate-binding protein